MKKVAFVSLFFAFLVFALPLPRKFNYAVLLLFLALDLYMVVSDKGIKNKEYVRWMFSFLSICALSIFWSISSKYSFYIIHSSVLPIFAVSYFIITYAKSYEELKLVLLAFYLSSIVFLVFIFSIIDITLLSEMRIGSAIVDEEMADKLNSNYIAGRFAIAIWVGFFLIYKLYRSNWIIKIVYWGISLVMAYAILVSGSRTSLAVLVLPVFVYFLKNSKSFVISVFGITLVIIVGYFLVMKIPQFYEIIGSRVEDAINVALGNDTGEEDTSRIALAELGLGWFGKRPILGYGINCFRVLSNKTSHFGGREIYAHNNYIELMVDIGLVGLIIYYSALFFLVRKYRSFFRRKKSGVVVLSLIVVILFSDIFWVAYFNALSNFMLTMTFVLVFIERRKVMSESLNKYARYYEAGRCYSARRH